MSRPKTREQDSYFPGNDNFEAEDTFENFSFRRLNLFNFMTKN